MKRCVQSIPAFPLACKMADLLNSKQMARIVGDLRGMDYYEFRVEVRTLLLA